MDGYVQVPMPDGPPAMRRTAGRVTSAHVSQFMVSASRFCLSQEGASHDGVRVSPPLTTARQPDPGTPPGR